MQIVLKIEMNEILLERAVYNYIVYKLIHPIFGCNYLTAKYDDVSEEAEIAIGDFFGDKGFIGKIHGISNTIDNSKIGFGGVWIKIDVYRPDLTFQLLKT